MGQASFEGKYVALVTEAAAAAKRTLVVVLCRTDGLVPVVLR